jgi:hypothetical protein
MNSMTKDTVVTDEAKSSIRIFGRLMAHDLTHEELDAVSGGLSPAGTSTKATDTTMQCDW